MYRIVALYERDRVMKMCRLDEVDGRREVMYGWDHEEEAYAYAPFVLKPKTKQQLSYLIEWLSSWIQDEEDYPDVHEREAMRCAFGPLIALNWQIQHGILPDLIWTEVHDEAFDSINNSGEWKQCYEMLEW